MRKPRSGTKRSTEKNGGIVQIKGIHADDNGNMMPRRKAPQIFGVFMLNDLDDDVKAAAAAGAGAATGAAGAVGAVSTLGVAGLGATGITSGLAAVGGLVGGGMAAGLAVTAAAPLAVGAIGYGLYKWLKD